MSKDINIDALAEAYYKGPEFQEWEEQEREYYIKDLKQSLAFALEDIDIELESILTLLNACEFYIKRCDEEGDRAEYDLELIEAKIKKILKKVVVL